MITPVTEHEWLAFLPPALVALALVGLAVLVFWPPRPPR